MVPPLLSPPPDYDRSEIIVSPVPFEHPANRAVSPPPFDHRPPSATFPQQEPIPFSPVLLSDSEVDVRIPNFVVTSPVVFEDSNIEMDLGSMLGVGMYQEGGGESSSDGLKRGKGKGVKKGDKGKGKEQEKEEEGKKEKKEKKQKKQKKSERDLFSPKATCPRCVVLSEGGELTPLPEFNPTLFAFNPERKASHKKEQNRMKQIHDKQLLSLRVSESNARSKKIAGQKTDLVTLEKQNRKYLKLEKREAYDRPARLISHHIIEVRLLAKEVVGYRKERLAIMKRELKEEGEEAGAESKREIARIKNEHSGDRGTIDRLVKREKMENKIRGKHGGEAKAHITEQEVQFWRLSKEFQLRTAQFWAVGDLQMEIRKKYHQLVKRQLQENHRERQRQLLEIQDEEIRGLSAKIPLEDKQHRERADLDLLHLYKEFEYEAEMLEQQITNIEKQDRKEFRSVCQMEQKQHEKVVRELKKAGKKGEATKERRRFDKEKEKMAFEFEAGLGRAAKKKQDRLVGRQEKRMREMRKAHKKRGKELRCYQELFRAHMEGRFVVEQRELLEELDREMEELKKMHKRREVGLRKKQHREIKEMVGKFEQEKKTLLGERVGEMRGMFRKHLRDLETIDSVGGSFVTEQVIFMFFPFFCISFISFHFFSFLFFSFLFFSFLSFSFLLIYFDLLFSFHPISHMSFPGSSNLQSI